ncbi:hypothetical protein AOZ06_04250 [Kibdelosporangium phytohabitans]|uniref:Uncharacterized protein n=1 Tax=Kibdelosporangium phytohabitans TaxID=860235 RepID=A0A0N9HW83_9PSEU|nr:hypothetical protein AOZ06_04250 [Kibdelosporangium phytohabitans]
MGESTPFFEVASFVDRARDAGATEETPVRAVPLEQDDSIIDHLVIELDSSARPAAPTVGVSVTVLRQLRDLLGEIHASDGDVRTLSSAIADAHRTVVKLVDGESIGQEIDWT